MKRSIYCIYCNNITQNLIARLSASTNLHSHFALIYTVSQKNWTLKLIIITSQKMPQYQ